MDVIKRFMLFDKTILVSVISAKELVDKAIKIHSLSRTAAAALGRTLIVGAYMGTELKDDKQKLSITINGGGPLGRIVVLSDYGAKVRGYVENPAVELPLNGKGKLDVGGGVGKNGYISVIKDLGLKEPYSGRCPIVDGEIANDFAYYFTVSEQQPSAVALGVLAADNECVSAGGIFVSALPGADDNAITVMEDILTNFTRVSDLFKETTPEDIIDRYFSHFDIFNLPDVYPTYECTCNRARLEQVGCGRPDQGFRCPAADAAHAYNHKVCFGDRLRPFVSVKARHAAETSFIVHCNLHRRPLAVLSGKSDPLLLSARF